jgi:hypothetical protein
MQSISYSLNHSLARSLTQSHSPTYSLSRPYIHTLTNSLTHSLTNLVPPSFLPSLPLSLHSILQYLPLSLSLHLSLIHPCSSFQGFPYAGTEWRNECHCGHSYTRYGPADYCDLSCVGDHGQNCGGDWALRVHFLGSGGIGGPGRGGRSLGCWADRRERAMNGAEMMSNAMTNSLCANFCTSKVRELL